MIDKFLKSVVDALNRIAVSLEAIARRMASLENNEADYHDRLRT